MKLERIGEWVRWNKDKAIWIKPDKIIITITKQSRFRVVARAGIDEHEKEFDTEFEAKQFAREIMNGGKE